MMALHAGKHPTPMGAPVTVHAPLVPLLRCQTSGFKPVECSQACSFEVRERRVSPCLYQPPSYSPSSLPVVIHRGPCPEWWYASMGCYKKRKKCVLQPTDSGSPVGAWATR